MQVLLNCNPRRLGLRTALPAFLLGFLASSFQIYLLREFFASFSGNELTYGFVLAGWLLWGGVGSWAARKLPFRPSVLDRCYTGLILAFPICLIALRLSRSLLGIPSGEIVGMIPIAGYSLAACLILGLPLGALFVFNSAALNGNVARVYFLESLGAAAAASLVSLALVPSLTNWQGGAAVAGLGAAGVYSAWPGSRSLFRCLLTTALLAGFLLLDLPLQKWAWKPLDLVESRESPHGTLAVIKTEEQVSFFVNSLIVFSSPDPAAAEESVHFALLQNPLAKRVLLIGGGVAGRLEELLKYPRLEVDYVELDPTLIRLAEKHLLPQDKGALGDSRVRIYYGDGRAYTASSETSYDMIILGLPEPATAQVNRFYTQEFFTLAKKKLATGGVLSFTAPSSEDYISPDLGLFLATLSKTLARVFPCVRVIPGDTNIFLASTSDLTIDPAVLGGRLEATGLHTRFVTAWTLRTRLAASRVEALKRRLDGSRAPINSDLRPVSYYFNSVLWARQFRGAEGRILRFLGRLPPIWIAGAPVLFLLILLASAAVRRRRSPTLYLLPLAGMGMTSIVAELVVIVAFQAFFGYIYGRIALLLAAFMAGLAIGARAGISRKNPSRGDLLACQAGFIGLLLVLQTALSGRVPEWLFDGLLLALGSVGGFLFVVSNRIYLLSGKDYGLGYALDLGGSFAGVLLATAVVIPLAGIPRLLNWLLFLNALLFVFILFLKSRETRGPEGATFPGPC